MKQKAWGLILAAGKSERISSEIETAFLYLNDRPVLAYSLSAFMQCPDIEGIVVSISRDRAESVLGMVQMYGFSKVKKIVLAGAKRSASMASALEYVDDEAEWVCVHDASRPFLEASLISETIKAARRHGSGIAAVELTEPVVCTQKGVYVSRAPEDAVVWKIISPQTYSRKALMKAYPKTVKERKTHKNDLSAMLALGEPLRFVTSPPSLCIRNAEDLALALTVERLKNP
ncbi:MAG: 2-C-methyl-D-erythritol 4-phosphate cytidylyltransferase [Verrucomicrobiota bacterium]|jgi:2-C-methyl-D-erythritol 4-phosphate cytidylyltransferase|nr:2-C-methyl-D-erythritol 4-phosphate cytidylyltransferase [Verrucomicrobiota bacterium]